MEIDLASVPGMPEGKLDVGLRNRTLAALRPLDQADGIGLARRVPNADELELAGVLYPVQVEMKKSCIFNDIAFLQGKRRAFYPA